MKHTALLATLAALLIANQSANAQGALTPPGSPAESQKSLQEIYVEHMAEWLEEQQ